jgi:hypothetical protein
MNKEKSRKNAVESESRQLSEEVTEPSEVLSFDAYFKKLLATKPSVQPHHKFPMKKYAEAKGFEVATEKQFDEIFGSY